MKLTIDRSIGAGEAVVRFALTVSVPQARELNLADQAVGAALAKAADLVQALLFPAPEPGWRHPQDYVLCQWAEGGALFRAAFRPGATVEDFTTPAYRYISDAYDERGKLLPVFWALPIIDLEGLPRP